MLAKHFADSGHAIVHVFGIPAEKEWLERVLVYASGNLVAVSRKGLIHVGSIRFC